MLAFEPRTQRLRTCIDKGLMVQHEFVLLRSIGCRGLLLKGLQNLRGILRGLD
jgi:hypothetical protein